MPCLVVGGLSFVLGVLVRPSALLGVVWLVVFAVVSVLAAAPGVVPAFLAACLLLLFVSGAAGHVLGLDGIISRNIRRPNTFTRFLFG